MPSFLGINKSMVFNKLLLGSIVFLVLFILPITVLVTKNQQEVRQRAAGTTVLSFSPETTTPSILAASPNSSVSLDVWIDPGQNMVSFSRLDINFDPQQLTPDSTNAFTRNSTAFPILFEGPMISSGKIQVTVSVGSDPSSLISQKVKVGTVKFTVNPQASGTSTVTFGSNTLILSAGANDQASDNVLASSIPATIQVNNPSVTSIPSTSPTLPPSASCPNDPNPSKTLDIMLVIDTSGSMTNLAVTSDLKNKLEAAKEAATAFVNTFSNNPNARIGLATFSGTNTTMSKPVNLQLSNNLNSVKTAIGTISATVGDSSTCMECGLKKAGDELATNGRSNAKKVIILLTDGRANSTIAAPYITSTNPGEKVSEDAAMTTAVNFFLSNTITEYTVGVGIDVNSSFLEDMAVRTGGKYYFTQSASGLLNVYSNLALVIIRGAVTGVVFNDMNTNKIYEANEPKLSGWKVILKDQAGNTVSNVTSNTSGYYTIADLCDGTYTVEEELQTGWLRTVPINPSFYNVQIDNAAAVAGKNFGNVVGGPVTRINFSAYLHGIGASGDNANNDSSLSNKNPLHPQRNVTLELYDQTNKLAASEASVMTFDKANGVFKGAVDLTTEIQTGDYFIKIKPERFLKNVFNNNGITKITAGEQNTLGPLSVVTGDINDDNKVNLLDYNTIFGCYSTELFPIPRFCDEKGRNAADLTDEGDVNQYDLNLFIRELSVQPGL